MKKLVFILALLLPASAGAKDVSEMFAALGRGTVDGSGQYYTDNSFGTNKGYNNYHFTTGHNTDSQGQYYTNNSFGTNRGYNNYQFRSGGSSIDSYGSYIRSPSYR